MPCLLETFLPYSILASSKDLSSAKDYSLHARHLKTLEHDSSSTNNKPYAVYQVKNTQFNNSDFYTGQTAYRSAEKSSKEAARRRLAARREAASSENASTNKTARHAKNSTDK